MATLIGFIFGSGLLLLLVDKKSPRIQLKKPQPTSPLWPQFIDDVSSGIRAGLNVAEAMWSAGERMPVAQAMWFGEARKTWKQEGLSAALQQLERECADTSFRQFIDVVRIVQESGSTNLASTLTELAQLSRASQQLVAEIKGRQAVTVVAARVAVAAPWVVLILTSARPETRSLYFSSTGIAVLGVVAVVSSVSYVAMRKLGSIEELKYLV